MSLFCIEAQGKTATRSVPLTNYTSAIVSAPYNTNDPFDLLQSIAEVIDGGGDRQHLQRSFSSQSDKLPSAASAADQLPVDDKDKEKDKAAIDAVKHSLLSDPAFSLPPAKEPVNGSLANANVDDLSVYPTTVSKSEPGHAVAVSGSVHLASSRVTPIKTSAVSTSEADALLGLRAYATPDGGMSSGGLTFTPILQQQQQQQMNSSNALMSPLLQQSPVFAMPSSSAVTGPVSDAGSTLAKPSLLTDNGISSGPSPPLNLPLQGLPAFASLVGLPSLPMPDLVAGAGAAAAYCSSEMPEDILATDEASPVAATTADFNGGSTRT